MDIRNLPYSAAEVIVRYLTLDKPLIRSVDKEGVELHLVEDVEDPKFHFTVEKVEVKNSDTKFIINQKPTNRDVPSARRLGVRPD